MHYFSMAEDGDGFVRRVSKAGFHFDALSFDWLANRNRVKYEIREGNNE